MTKTVANLKSAISKEAQPELDEYAAHTLILHLIRIDFDDSEDEDHLQGARDAYQRLSEQKFLRPLVKLSTVFATEPPSDECISWGRSRSGSRGSRRGQGRKGDLDG